LRNGSIDLDSFRRLLDDLAGNVAGVVVGGSVGEGPSLAIEERVLLYRAAAEHWRGVGALVLSISDNSIEHTRRLAAVAGELRADLVLVSLPTYFTNDRTMMQAYIGAVSEFAPTGLCLYDNPTATHTTLSIEDIRAMADAAPRLTSIKVTDPALGKVEALVRHTTLRVFTGDDVVLWLQLCRGACGAMVALPMIFPDRVSAFWRAYAAGDDVSAQQHYRTMSSFIHVALGAPDYVSVIKAVLHHRGVIASPEVRLPLVTLSPRRLNEVLTQV